MPAFTRGGFTPPPIVGPPGWPAGWEGHFVDLEANPPELFDPPEEVFPPGWPITLVAPLSIEVLTANASAVIWQTEEDGTFVDPEEGTQNITVAVTVRQAASHARHLLVVHIGWDGGRGPTRSTPVAAQLNAATGDIVYEATLPVSLRADDLEETNELLVRAQIITAGNVPPKELAIDMYAFTPTIFANPTCSAGALSVATGVDDPTNGFAVDEVTAATVTQE